VNRWGILAVLFFARTAMGFQFQSVAAVSPLLVEHLALDFALLGALIGAWMLPGVALAIPGGLLGQRFGDKPVVIAGLALMVLGSVVVAEAPSYSVAIAGRLLSGAGAVALNVLLAKMVADWFQQRELASAMSLLVVSWPLGIGLALAILGPLAAAHSWTLAMHLTGWLCAAALVAVAMSYRAPPGAGTRVQTNWRLGRRDLALAGVAGLVWTFYNVGYILVVSFAPMLLASRGTGMADAAILSSFATWALMISVPLGGYLADRTGRGDAIMLGSLLLMAGTMPFILAVPAPLVMLSLFGLIAGPAGGIIAALPARAIAPQSRHLGLGLFFTLYYAGMALLPAVAGWLRDATRVDTAPLAFGAGLLLLAAALAGLFRRLERWPSA
jgi:predicted MFS family arabinose efflux permease